jgi:signal transduction histidine kinase
LSATADGPSGATVPHSRRTRQLASAVRATATAAAAEVGGGLALVFTSTPNHADPASSVRLRGAAGFPSARAAREAADRLLPRVREALVTQAVGSHEPEPVLGEHAAGGLVIHPLLWEERVHGALLVGCPGPLEATRRQSLAGIAEVLALRFDHAHVAEACALAQQRREASDEGDPETNEEILKLSEALFAQDIELLRSNEKLGKIEKLKNDFIERMSRELRTPLNSIIEAIISVLTGENEALSEGAKESLRSALDDGTAFLRTLQNILDLWRIKQGELPVEIQDVNFRETVDEAIFSVQDAIDAKPISVEQQFDEHFPKIRTDLTKISQILFMLLDNAVKFTPSGKIVIAGRVSDDRLHCQIRDTGVGICADDQPCIFDEFFQVDEPASQRYTGSGLGLALVRDLIVLLDGEISVSSEVGSGTTLSFSLPVQVVG